MRIRTHRHRHLHGTALLAGLLAAFAVGQSSHAQTDPGDVALAARFTELGQNTVRGQTQNISDANFRLAAAMFEAAARLDPSDARFPRLQADALLQARDPEGALKALNAYLSLRRDDRFAQIQFAELVASRYEVLDERLAYLKEKVADNRVPPDVRGHLAFRAAQVSLERSDTDAAKQFVDAALKLNPLSLEALRLYYQQTAVNGTSLQRISTLLSVLRSNPNQPEAVKLLAQQLADVGLAQPAVVFYALGVNLTSRAGRGVSRDEALGYGCELYLLNQSPMTRQIVDQLLPSNFADYELAMLRLLSDRAGEAKEFTEKAQQQARNAFVNRLSMLHRAMGDTTATTRPVESATPVEFGDLTADVRKLKADPKPAPVEPAAGATPAPTEQQLHDAWANCLADLAWYQIYFLQKPEDAKPTIDALRELVGEKDPVIARLEGWSFLVNGRTDEARVKLSAVADTDALSRLGIIRLLAADPRNQARAKEEGEKLLLDHASGIAAVTIVDALRDVKVALNPPAERVAPINTELNAFPMAWLQVLDRPQNYYTVQVEPPKVAHPYGEPIIVNLTVQNVCDYPITLGPDGVLHQDLWFDAMFRGVAQQAFAGTAIDRLGGPLVLQPRQSISQSVRLDQGALSQTLQASPFPSLQVVAQLRTNPNGANGIGPAGQVVTNLRSIERTGFSLDGFANLLGVLTRGNSGEKIRAIDLTSAVTGVLLQQANNEQAKQAAIQAAEAIRGVQRDPSPSVAAWGGGVLVFRLAEADRPAAVQRLTNDPAWQARMVGLAVTGVLPVETRRAILKQVADHDTDPLVRRYAAAGLEVANAEPATKPTTGPATAPEKR